MLEQAAVWIIVAAAAAYASVTISRTFRKSGKNCGNCGRPEEKPDAQKRR